MFDVKSSNVVIAVLNVHCRFLNWSPADYQYIEDGEYTVFGRQFDNDYSKVDFDNGIKVDL